MTRKHRAGLAWVLLIPLAAGPAGAEPPVGTAFTYQGRLTSSGTVANGPYDFEFRLYDDPLAGNLVAGPIAVPSVLVTSGLFTAPLDFGSTPFAGKVRWLAIAVKASGSADPFTTLDRRQVLSPTPYAVFSSYTDPANLTNLDASHLTSGVLPSAQLSGSYTSALSLTSPSNVFVGNGSGLSNLNAQAKYLRTVVVSPVGSPAANGAALLAALAAISSPSPTNPWLLKLEPGVYNVGSSGALVMRPFVDIEGSGESVTKITSPGSASNIVGTVQTAINTELRHVTVENTGGAAFARPLYVTSGSPRISHVTVLGSGGTVETHGYYADGSSTAIVTDLVAQVIAPPGAGSFGILNVGASSVMSNVQSYALGGSFSQAVWNCCGAAPTMRNLFASASGATTDNRGMTNTDASTTPTLENVVALGTGGANSYGILNLNGTAPFMRLVSCRALGATGNNYGCSNEVGTHPTMMDIFGEGAGGLNAEGVHISSAAAGLSLTHVRAVASGASSGNRGVFVSSASPSITQLEALAFGAGTSEAAGISLSSSSSSLTLATAAGSTTGTGNGIGVRVTGAGPTLSHVVATGTGGNMAVGVWSAASSTPTMTNVTVSAANGSGFTAGLFNQASSIVGLSDSTVTAAGPAASNIYGIWNQGATLVTLSGARATASGTGATTYGMLNNSTAGTVKVERSTLSGATGSIQNATAFTVNVAGSQLAGAINAVGTYTCVFSYNGAFAALNGTCN